MHDRSLETYLEELKSEIEAALPQSFPESWYIPAPLKEAMLYSLMAGGKRLRPIFVLAACESCMGTREAAMSVACAVEMIHTYSLIHDDLPAMDNDDYRRGRPTNHKVYGEATAILAGDALLTHAFYSVTQAGLLSSASAEVILKITAELAMFAGMRGMVGGQMADMQGEQGLTSIEQLEYIHLHKTSDLIIFALRAGGMIGGASEKQLEALTAFGRNLGLAFQIQDDILDIVGDETVIGKPKGSDEKSGKVTYPYFIGLQASKQEVERLTREAKDAILEADLPQPKRLLELADYLMNRDR
ncbi:polyprenyl synthetase family protein [Paenibacillus sp. 1001270B_150601_E10]|uniref:polyprenyl synthetase family protein n=1 Tax=Paenibacillus sp. 1001270B_150601_E10 TaxID=2787079 RepID=UPI00189F928F|nr:farnesyl diphosphate synthase [Paenibacillus sp. 1001270B_150601_E10]